MSKPLFRRLLWLALLLTVPVPMWFIGPGRIPTLALLQISSAMAAVMTVEPGEGVWLACWVLGVQGLTWAVVLYVVARIAAAVLTRTGDGRAPLAAVGVVLATLLGLSAFDVYFAPIVGRGAPTNLLGVY